MAFVDKHDVLSFFVYESGRVTCDLCSRERWCSKATFRFGFHGEAKISVCETCLWKILRFTHDPAMEIFLRKVMEAYVEWVAWNVNYDREEIAKKTGLEQYGRRAPEWMTALEMLYRAFRNGRGAEGNVAAVAEAVQNLTGLDVIRGRALVEKVFASEKAKLPPSASPDPMTQARTIAEDLLAIAGKGAEPDKIRMIRVVGTATGLGLLEARDVVEAAMARQAANRPTPTNGQPVVARTGA